MIKKFLLATSFVAVLFTSNVVVNAAEYLTDEQIEQIVAPLEEDYYVLPTPDGGLVMNMDGSPEFPEEQIEELGEALTVPEYREYLKTLDISDEPAPTSTRVRRAAHVPTRRRIIYANQTYLSNPFSARGWRYGEWRFFPAFGTGDYLHWTALGDGGVVEDGQGVYAPMGAGELRIVYSRRGTYFKTYNPVPGSQYVVSNPV